MADTRVQLEVEDSVRDDWMRGRYGTEFHRKRVRLNAGGVFDFDAVSADLSIVAAISTSGGKTRAGKLAVGKLMKLRSDMLFLTMIEKPCKKLLVLTDRSMLTVCEKEREGGRVPVGIEFVLAEIPVELERRLAKARQAASDEVTPKVVDQLPDEVLLAKDDTQLDPGSV
ncbi:MAG TPA: hypothetical protein VG889_21065 [Rhizomicrobium sp.]|nr:hypothetical protein [Rhizomicrobium sp.]